MPEKAPNNLQETTFIAALKTFQAARDRFVETLLEEGMVVIHEKYFIAKGMPQNDAKDLLQELRGKLLRNISQFGGRSLGEFRAWCESIAESVYCHYLKDIHRHQIVRSGLPPEDLISVKGHQEEFSDEECRELISVCLKAFPPENGAQLTADEAAVLVLQILGYSEKESHTILNDFAAHHAETIWKRGKLAVTRFRAREKMRNYVQEEGWSEIPSERVPELYASLRQQALAYLAAKGYNIPL